MDTVVFSSSRFEKVIRQMVGKDRSPITQDDLGAIETLYLDPFDGPIGDDVMLLKHFKNLKSLSIYIRQCDLPAICELDTLENLEITLPDGVFDCSLLSKFSRLRFLGIYGELFSQISIINFGELAACNILDEILIFESKTLDIRGISNIRSLKRLFIHVTHRLENPQEIKDIKLLEYLDFCDVSLESLDFLNDVSRDIRLELCAVETEKPINMELIGEFHDKNITEMQ